MDIITFLRQYKVGPFAIFDTAISYLGIYLIAPYLSKIFILVNLNVPRSSWLWFTLPIAVIFHLIVRQNTPLMKILGSSYKPEFYLGVSILFFMTYMGIKGIKK